jgi:hypothetical protein
MIPSRIGTSWGMATGTPAEVSVEMAMTRRVSPPAASTRGADGVGEVVLGGHEDDKTRRGRFAAGEGIAAGDASRELAEEGALAEAGIAIEDGDLARREPTGREPVQSFRRDLTQCDEGSQGFASPCGRLRGG